MSEHEALDPDDPRPPYIQVANVLRAAILSKTLKPGDKLPSGSALASRYNVARMTIQNALRILRDEGLIVSRQGTGVFVRGRAERPVGLRPHIEQAFRREHVSIDFAGFSGETLHGALVEPLDMVRGGRFTPESITVRALVPDVTRPMPIPCRVEDLADDPDFRARARNIMLRSLPAIVDALHELQDLGLVKTANAEIRTYPGSPLFKLYIINNEDVFFGFYPVREHAVTIKSDEHKVYDLLGKDATLFHHAADDDETSTGSQYVEEARTWFSSLWSTVARPLAL